MTGSISVTEVRDELPELATRPQVAEYLQISVSTLARWAMDGRGPRVTKLGTAARYRREHVVAWLEESR